MPLKLSPLLIALALSTGSARAAELRYYQPLDPIVTGVSAATWISLELLKGNLAPETCRWCSPGGVDTSARNALRWNEPNTANRLSNLAVYAVLPATVLGLGWVGAKQADHPENFVVDSLIVVEAVAVSGVIGTTAKYIAGRERPFVHALPPDEKAQVANPTDNNVSFYSAHTSTAFAFVVSSGTTASVRGYKTAPWIWGLGLPLASLTGYLRIAADKHYLTDVLTGAVVGAAVGYFTVQQHRTSGSKDEGVQVTALPIQNGGRLEFAWRL